MSRLQLALNVSDLDAAIDFYSRLFATPPRKVQPGYLKLVLIENQNAPGGSINHLGVEVFSVEDVASATQRLASEGMDTDVEMSTTCCYAVQDKVWVSGPDAERWEVYTVLADADSFGPAADEACCVSESPSEPISLRSR